MTDPAIKNSAGRGEIVLIVDDNDAVRVSICRVLARYGYRTVEARSGEEAIELWHSYVEPIDVVVTDFVLPGLNGLEFVQQIKNVNRETRILLVSGHDRDAVRLDEMGPSITFLSKPFMIRELVEQMRILLDHKM